MNTEPVVVVVMIEPWKTELVAVDVVVGAVVAPAVAVVVVDAVVGVGVAVAGVDAVVGVAVVVLDVLMV